MRILFTCKSAAGELSSIVAIYEAIIKANNAKGKKGLKSIEFALAATDSDFARVFVHDTKIKYKNLGWGKENILTSIIAFLKVIPFIFTYMPDVIFAKSGYASISVVIAGRIFGIPVIMHDSDILPDGMELFMARFSKRVAISFGRSGEFYDPKKVFLSGNPVNISVTQGSRERGMEKFMIDGDKPVIFVMGGSEGAEQINNLVLEVLPKMLERYEVIHQCGIGNYDEVKERVEKMNMPFLNDYHLFPFLKEGIADVYAVADLIVGRAGSSTVAEIVMVGKPSILIPLSMSEDSKQTRNAYYYSETGAVLMLNEKNLKPSLFLNAINGIFENRLKMMEMTRMARKLARFNSADIIADEIIKIGR